MPGMVDHYRVLEIPRDASKEDVKRAWKRLAELYHPDKVRHLGPRLLEVAEEEMRKLNLAKETLLDDARREEYDLMLAESERPPRPAPPPSMVDDERPAVRVEVEPMADDRGGIPISRKPYTSPSRAPPVQPARDVRVVVEAIEEGEASEDGLDEFQGTPVCDSGDAKAPPAEDGGPRVTRFVPIQPIPMEPAGSGMRSRKKKKRRRGAGPAADAGTGQPVRI